MHIDDAIKMLRDAKQGGTKHIVLAFWEAEMFERQDDGEWADAAELVEEEMDWSNAHEAMSDIMDANDGE